jgi:hypothetical protein
MPEKLPEDVYRFVIEQINSVEQLETLLLLRASPEQAWSVETVSHALYTSPAAAAMRLSDLQARGLLVAAEQRDSWQYRAANAELDALVGRLAEAYKERRVTVISLIYSKPQQEVQAFADAFRLRKDT